MENNIYNWLMAYKYEGAVVSTFMKMNIQGGNIKLVSSTVFVHKKWFKNINKINFYEVKYVFFIKNYLDEDCEIFSREDQYGNKYYEISIGMQKLINFIHEGLVNPNSYELGDPSKATSFWWTLDYGLSREKSVDKIISNGVFIFLSDAWYNIVLAFKLSNIELNGGKISNRHIMKPSDFVLGSFVNKLMISCDTELKLDTINKFYSNSYKNEMLSNRIDLNLYNKYKDNEHEIKYRLYKDEYFGNKDKELNQAHFIIKGYLFYNYNTHCELLRKEINKKFYTLLNKELVAKVIMENNSDDIKREIKGLRKYLPLQNISKKKKEKKGVFFGMSAELIDKKSLEMIKVKNDIISKEELINYLKNLIDKEYENNDFNKYNLIELEKYSKNLTELMEVWMKNYKKSKSSQGREIIVNNPIVLENHNGNGNSNRNGNGQRGYHTNNGGRHSLILPKISKQVYMNDNKKSADYLNQRYYSNESIEHKNDENFSIFNYKMMREKFLNEVSLFNKRLKEMIEGVELNSDEDRFNLQKKIEEYCLNYDYDWYLNLFLKKNSQFDPIFLSLMKDWYFNIEQELGNFIHEYEINDFEKLITGIKKKDSKVEVIFTILAIKYFVIERNKKSEESLEKYISETEFSEEDKKRIFNKLDGKFSQKELYNIISVIIGTIIFLISNNFKEDDNDIFETTQSYLTIMLGDNILKKVKVNLSDLFLNKFNDVDKEVVIKYFNDHILNPSEETIGNVGANFLELLMNSADIFETKKRTVNNKTNIYIKISSDYIQMFSNRLLHPNKLPMVFPPLNWDSTKLKGGYINSQYKRLINANLIHKNKRNRYQNELSDAQYNTVNYLNNQKFKIDKDMLNFLLVEYTKENSIVFEGRNKYDDTVVNNSNKNKIKSHNSKYILYRYVISLAIAYESVYFYIPTFLDFRGRVYSIVDYLSYQGEDMARSLIVFNKGCVINKDNIIYPLQHLANTAGKSKLTIRNKNRWASNFINQLKLLPVELDHKDLSTFFKDRKNKINLFEDLKVSILDLAEKDDVKKVMSNTDEKFQFLNILFNLIKCLIKPNELFSTPICFDATTSGFQHLAALFQDIEIANASNVINVNNTENHEIENVNPGDVYQKVANTAIDLINKEVKDVNLKNKFLKIKINRKLLKKPCMTVPYNVGLQTMHKDLISAGFFIKKVDAADINKKDKSTFYIVSKELLNDVSETVVLKYDELFKFSKFLYDSVYVTFPSLKGYVNYINQFANVISKLDVPIMWTTPVGMKIYMGYTQFEKKNTKIFLKKRKRGSTINLPINKMDKIANKIAFMPNFIHSMDSTNVQLLIQNLLMKNEFINLFTIHDCFASTPETMRLLNFEVRKAFTMMYFDQNYIYTMHRNFLNQIISHTTIYQENEDKESIALDLQQIETSETAKNDKLFILVGKKKVSIPKIPFNVDWELVKPIFEEGIIKSIYFIN